MGYVGYEGPDPVSKVMLDQLAGLCTNYTNIQTKLAAADGDKEAALTSWMDTAENTQADRLRKQIETARAKLRALAEENVTFEEWSEEDKTRATTEMDDLKTKIKAGFEVARNLVDTLSTDPEGVKAALETIENPVKTNRGRKPGGSGSALPRASVNIEITGGTFSEEGTPNEFDSFSRAALALGCDVKDLQVAFANAAGVKHEDIKSVSKPVEFTFKLTENGTDYLLKTSPKIRQKPGPRTSGGKATAEESTEEVTDESVQAEGTVDPNAEGSTTEAA